MLLRFIVYALRSHAESGLAGVCGAVCAAAGKASKDPNRIKVKRFFIVNLLQGNKGWLAWASVVVTKSISKYLAKSQEVVSSSCSRNAALVPMDRQRKIMSKYLPAGILSVVVLLFCLAV